MNQIGGEVDKQPLCIARTCMGGLYTVRVTQLTASEKQFRVHPFSTNVSQDAIHSRLACGGTMFVRVGSGKEIENRGRLDLRGVEMRRPGWAGRRCSLVNL